MSDETPQTSDQSDTGGPAKTAAPPPAGAPHAPDAPERHDPPQDPSLKDQLAALKREQAAFDARLVGKAIADLEKLITEVDTAKQGYSKAAYDKLVVRQSALEDEMKTLDKALTAALGQDMIEEVKAIEAAKLDAIDAAAITLNEAADALAEKKAVASEKEVAMAQAQAALDRWRKPADSIEKRQKAAASLIDEIKKLRNGPHRGEAYWKLALGDRNRLSEQDFVHLLLKDPPELVSPDALDAKIEAAWSAFTTARAEAAAAQAEAVQAGADHKAAKADYDAQVKSIIKTIIDALAAHEAPPAA